MKLWLVLLIGTACLCAVGAASKKAKRMSDTNLFLSLQHPTSKRWAVLEDDGTSAWLYFTKPNTKEPVADVLVYNRIPPIAVEKVSAYRNGPPPVAVGYASAEAYLPHPDKGEFHLHWSADGKSVAVLRGAVPVACILHAEHKGFSKSLVADCPWGQTWDQARYDKTFHP